MGAGHFVVETLCDGIQDLHITAITYDRSQGRRTHGRHGLLHAFTVQTGRGKDEEDSVNGTKGRTHG